MIRSLLGDLDMTIWPEISLVIFGAVFIAICIRVLRTSAQETDYAAHVVLTDEPGGKGR